MFLCHPSKYSCTVFYSMCFRTPGLNSKIKLYTSVQHRAASGKVANKFPCLGMDCFQSKTTYDLAQLSHLAVVSLLMPRTNLISGAVVKVV